MTTRYAYTSLAAVLLLTAALGSGCQWMDTGSQASKSAEGDANVPALRAAIEAQTMDNARKQVALDQANKRIQLLQEELSTVRTDLEFVERQFVLFERRLTNEETKASAVSAVAEVQLLRDKLQADRPLEEETLKEVESRLAAANVLVDKHKYTAAVYYANRAMRTLNHAERVRNAYIDGDALVVAVSNANLRQGPGGKFDVLTRLTYGTAVVRLGKQEEWMKVRTRNGQIGWIHTSLLR